MECFHSCPALLNTSSIAAIHLTSRPRYIARELLARSIQTCRDPKEGATIQFNSRVYIDKSQCSSRLICARWLFSHVAPFISRPSHDPVTLGDHAVPASRSAVSPRLVAGVLLFCALCVRQQRIRLALTLFVVVCLMPCLPSSFIKCGRWWHATRGAVNSDPPLTSDWFRVCLVMERIIKSSGPACFVKLPVGPYAAGHPYLHP
jgi:hypothetical protein